MKWMLVLLTASCASAAAAQAVPPVSIGKSDGPFRGGPYDGLSVGNVVDPNGNRFVGLLASKAKASPIPAGDAGAVSVFISDHDNANSAPLKAIMAPRATSTVCYKQDQPCNSAAFKSLSFAEKVSANAPYYMKDGTVRVEWLYGDALYYISVLKMHGGKIAAVRTNPAWMPLQLSTKGGRPNG